MRNLRALNFGKNIQYKEILSKIKYLKEGHIYIYRRIIKESCWKLELLFLLLKKP